MLTHLALVISFALPPIFFPQTKSTMTAPQVVTQVQKFYKDTKQLTAKFRQTTTQKAFGRKEVSDGKVFIKKPGKMRWDYTKADKRAKKAGPKVVKSFISDGKVLWAIFHSDKQYYRRDLKKDLLPVAVSFLYGEGDLSRDFASALEKSGKFGEKTDFVLKLTPKKPSAQYKTLWLVVDPDNYRVKQSIVENSAGDTNHFRFFEPDTATAVDAKVFAFDEKAAKTKDYRLASPPAE